MSRKAILTMLSCFILIILIAANAQAGPVRAQGGVVATVSASGDDFDAQITVTGTIQSITPQSQQVSIVLLVDGTSFLINPASQGAGGLQPGQTIIVIASIDGDQLVGKVIAAVEGTEVPTVAATVEATAAATVAATPAATLPATPAATAAAALCGGNNQQPVATRLAAAFGVSYDEIMGWHCQGMGFGEIAKAYLLAKKTGKAPADYFALRAKGEGWGNIIKDEKVKPQDLALGQVDKDKNGKDKSTLQASSADQDKSNQGNGNNGNGNNGKDKSSVQGNSTNQGNSNQGNGNNGNGKSSDKGNSGKQGNQGNGNNGGGKGGKK